MQYFSASSIFTGQEWVTERVIAVTDGKISGILDPNVLPRKDLRHFNDCMIVPAFIDVQVYGAADKLLAVDNEVDTLEQMNRQFSETGTILFLPTLATNTMDVFKKSIDVVRQYWNSGGSGVAGLHLEGPWLNPEKKGAHIAGLIHQPATDEVMDLLAYGRGVIKMITLAPEQCSDEVIKMIKDAGIIVSAGHSNASYHQAMNSFNGSVSAVTHLFNAMSAFHHREPGLVGAVFNHAGVVASIIPDGHHVEYSAIRIAEKIMGPRLFAITDAVAETDRGFYQHKLVGDKYECNGILSGSALSMHKAFKNLVTHVGIEVGEALRMCSLYPAQVLACDDRFGKIAPHYTGQFLVLDKQLEIVEVIL